MALPLISQLGQSRLFSTTTYLLGFVFAVIFDLFIIGRPYYSGLGDGLSSSFFLSVNAFIGDYYDIHQLAFLNNTIGAAIIAITGLPNQTLFDYAVGVLIVHGLVVSIIYRLLVIDSSTGSGSSSLLRCSYGFTSRKYAGHAWITATIIPLFSEYTYCKPALKTVDTGVWA